MSNYKIGVEFEADGSKAVAAINQVAQAMQGLQTQAGQSAVSFGTSMSKIGSKLSSFGANMSAMFSVPLALLGKSLFTSASQIEQTAVSLKVFTGNAETAKRLMQEFKDVAINSPLQFQDINKGAQTLMGYGVTATQVTPIIKMLGDISGGNADKFNRLALAFGQVNAAGRLMGQENRQMINAGFNPLLAISEKTGQSMESLTKRMHDGSISVQEVADAFFYATSEGGRFEGMAAQQAETLGGMWNKLSESVSLAMADIGISLAKNSGIKKWFENLTNAITNIKESFLKLSPGVQEFILKIGVALTLIGPIILGLAAITTAVGTLAAAFVALNVSTGGILLFAGLLATTIVGVGIASTELSRSNSKLNDSLNQTNKVAQGFSLSPMSEQITKLESEIKSLEQTTSNSTFLSQGFGKIKGVEVPNNLQQNRLSQLKAELQNLKNIQQQNLGFSKTGKGGGDDISKAELNKIEKLKQQAKDGFTKLSDMYKAYTMSKTDIMKQDAEEELTQYRKYGIKTVDIQKNQWKQIQRVASEETRKLSALVNKTLTVDNLKSSLKKMVDDQAEKLTIVKDAMDKALVANKEKVKSTMSYKDALEYVFGGANDLEKGVEDNVTKISNLKDRIGSAFLDFRTNVINGFGEIAGGFLTGATNFSDSIAMVGSMLANTLGDLLIQVGTNMTMVGSVMVAVQKAIATIMENPVASLVVGGLAIAAGYALKSIANKTNEAISNNANAKLNSKSTIGSTKTNGMTSGSSYQYGGASYATQTVRLSIDLTGAITASPTGYNINKSLETVLRVTGR